MVPPAEFNGWPEAAQQETQAAIAELEKELEQTLRAIPRTEKEQRDAVRARGHKELHLRGGGLHAFRPHGHVVDELPRHLRLVAHIQHVHAASGAAGAGGQGRVGRHRPGIAGAAGFLDHHHRMRRNRRRQPLLIGQKHRRKIGLSGA